MAILIVLVILGAPYLLAGLLCAKYARTPAVVQPQRACAAAPGGAQTGAGSPNGSAWTALDERELIRLLTDAAPRAETE